MLAASQDQEFASDRSRALSGRSRGRGWRDCAGMAIVIPAEAHMGFVEARNLPQHVGIIMDGNRRWAEGRALRRIDGHREGAKAVRRIVTVARRLGLRALTLYAFSEQNWARPDDEVAGLMELLCDFLQSEREAILGNRIRLNAVGNLSRLPALVRAELDPLRAASDTNEGMTLTLALSFGGREEFADAARELAQEVASGRLRPDDVTCEALRKRIPSLSVGDPDLVIRTGGEQRISNFLLYGVAYAELYFADVLWPDFDARHLFEAVSSYQARERRFGRVAPHPTPGLVAAVPPVAATPPESGVGVKVASSASDLVGSLGV